MDLNYSSPQNSPSCMIVLVHHGHALGRDVDPTQPLSGRGLAASQRLVVEVAARGVKPDVIWHSGKFRARQTAELFWHACNPGAAFSVARGLQPADPPHVIQDQLETGNREVLLVGHMPHLTRLLRTLCRQLHDGPSIEFPEHGCVALQRQAGRWEELWRLDVPLADPC